MKCHIDDADSLLADATKTWSELDELPHRLELQQSIQNIEKAIAAMKEEVKSLGALANMKRTTIVELFYSGRLPLSSILFFL